MANEQPDKPLVTESMVTAYERAREERGQPPSEETEAVGAINRLIETLRATSAAFAAAARKAEDTEHGERIADEALAQREVIRLAAERVRSLGGAPSDEARATIPHQAGDFDYVQNDEDLEAKLADNRRHIAEAWTDAARHIDLPRDLVERCEALVSPVDAERRPGAV